MYRGHYGFQLSVVQTLPRRHHFPRFLGMVFTFSPVWTSPKSASGPHFESTRLLSLLQPDSTSYTWRPDTDLTPFFNRTMINILKCSSTSLLSLVVLVSISLKWSRFSVTLGLSSYPDQIGDPRTVLWYSYIFTEEHVCIKDPLESESTLSNYSLKLKCNWMGNGFYHP